MAMLKIAPLAAITLGLWTSFLFAADHAEAPQVRIDPAADLNDIYVFMNPDNSSELILISSVLPAAGIGSQFSDAVEYKFHVSNDASPNSYVDFTCIFPVAGQFSCSLADRAPLVGNIGEVVSGPDFRVFTGLRDDPFFLDGGAFTNSVVANELRFNDPGNNDFAGLDILAIVIGINPSVFSNNGANPVLGVYATTNRISGGTLNGSVSGNFFNTKQAGHGFFLEIIEDSGKTLIFVAWMVFHNLGNPSWIVGQGPTDGLTATAPAQRLSGAMFPPNFNPNDVVRTNVGTLVFDFTDCNHAAVDFQSADEAELGSVSLSLTRLTTIQGRPCELVKNGQIDRMGRPGINSALIDLLASTGAKDRYNEAADPATWAGMFEAEIAANLVFLDDLDGVSGNALIDAGTLARVLVNDVLFIDTSIASCDDYLAVELGFKQQCGGRTLSRDVIDDTLSILIGPGVSDGVGDDSQFLSDFPFLGVPNSQ